MQETHDLDSVLSRARAKRKRTVIILTSLVTLVILTYLFSVFLVKGVRIQVLPSEATSTAHLSLQKGLGLVSGEQVYLLSARAELTVSADTFQSQTLVLDGSKPTLVVELEPKPAIVELTTPYPDTQFDWFINHTWYASSSVFNAELSPGEYQITASHPWFTSTTLSLVAERAKEIKTAINPTKIVGQVTLNSVPSGAAVFIDGKLQGITPTKLTLEGGKYPVSLSLDGFEPTSSDFEVSSLLPEITRRFTLTPLQAALQMTLVPAGGVLTVDGDVRLLGQDGLVSVDANKLLSVRYEQKGFLPWQKTLTLAPKQRHSEAVVLSPEMGKVSINSNVQADIVVDGKSVGSTPKTLSLQALPIQIELVRAGYRSHVATVTPTKSQAQHLNVTLLSEFDARRKESKPLYATKLGIEFVPVKGGRFTMGSAVNEPERQRDEHQIEVNLSKPFLVSTKEITQTQYHAFDPSVSESQLPVTNVTWFDAVRYCNWLSAQEGLTPYYLVSGTQVTLDSDSKGYRLLSEAEWEYIAKHYQRAARTTFVWGSDERLSTKQGNFADKTLKGKQTFVFEQYEDGFAERAPVGSFKADRNGFFDLDGNVREWVTDSYVLIPTATQQVDNYVVLNNTESHVIKGASFQSGRLKMLRASVRGKGADKYDDVGFRIARYQ
jgi:formylglycine-generating enzyme required for sulfatase activity